jgi:hypothetical protein
LPGEEEAVRFWGDGKSTGGWQESVKCQIVG